MLLTEHADQGVALRHFQAVSRSLTGLGLLEEGILHGPAAAPDCAHLAYMFSPLQVRCSCPVVQTVVAACVHSFSGAVCGGHLEVIEE